MNSNLINFFKNIALALIFLFGFLQTTQAQTVKKKTGNGQTLAGAWNVTIESDRGGRKGNLVIGKNGTRYAGKYVGTESGDERELTDFTIKKNAVAFGFQVEREGQEIEFEFKAKLNGQHMEGTWSAFMEQTEVASGIVTAVRQLELSDFRGYSSEEVGAGWSMADGVLHFDGNKCGDLITKQEFANFVLEFEWK